MTAHNAGPSGRIQLQPNDKALVPLDWYSNTMNVLRSIRDGQLTIYEMRELAAKLVEDAGDAVPVVETVNPHSACEAVLDEIVEAGDVR